MFRAIDPGQKSCNENVDVSDLLLDGARIAHGGLLINSTMGGNVGPDVYSVNFMKAGISVSVSPAWLCLIQSLKQRSDTRTTRNQLVIISKDGGVHSVFRIQ